MEMTDKKVVFQVRTEKKERNTFKLFSFSPEEKDRESRIFICCPTIPWLAMNSLKVPFNQS